MNDLVNEPFGFKVSMAGGAAWIASLLQGIDLTQMLGFVALVVGVFIQIISYFRNTNADKRDREADDRAKIKYDLEMKVLAKELQEIESRIENGKS
jgi:hypothetical protein